MTQVHDHSAPVRYVAIVPLFRHSVLVVDALDSLLEQYDADSLRIIVVDDGCPNRETSDVLNAFAATYPEQILCVRQRNRGLSGARNTGIEIALARYPDALGLYFLDADNRLEPWALTRVGEACAAYPEADWFFPDIVYFGLKYLWDGSGRYDGLEHLAHNYCEAGSFVRMRLFASGVRFDETMKLGYEDWDFWLQALGRGFHGRHLPDSGFRYRKRGESMLSDSERDRHEILGYLRRKHQRSFSPRTLLQKEAHDRPRSCFVDLVSQGIRLALSPVGSLARSDHALEPDELALRLASFGNANLGQQVFFGSDAVWRQLAMSSLLPWALREIEILLDEGVFVALRIVNDRKPGAMSVSGDAFPIDQAGVIAISIATLSEICHDGEDDRLRRLVDGKAEATTRFVTIYLPSIAGEGSVDPPGSLLSKVIVFADELRASVTLCADMRTWPHRPSHRLDFAAPLRIVEDWHGLRRPFPRVSSNDSIDVGFVLPIGAFGGVERVAHQTATAIRARGHKPHLIIAGSSELSLPKEFTEVYDTIRFSTPAAVRPYSWNEASVFLGTPLPTHHSQHAGDLAGLCADLDVVINGHSAPLNYAMSTLRRAGISTCCTQHVFDLASGGRPVGHPLLGVAFEYAYDLMLPVSDMMARQLHGLGVPADKLLLVRNAGGIVLEEQQVATALSARRQRSGPLRCMFLGRLDKQKGVDRLAALILACRTNGPAIDWRIVGKPIVDSNQGQSAIEKIAIEPAVIDGAEIAACLAWADVVVMPSLYEGLPLLAFDAMAMGCVLVASDAGATGELVRDGKTGFLVAQDGVVDAMAAILRRLADDRSLCVAMGERAASAVKAQSWQHNVDPLVNWMERRQGSRRAAG